MKKILAVVILILAMALSLEVLLRVTYYMRYKNTDYLFWGFNKLNIPLALDDYNGYFKIRPDDLPDIPNFKEQVFNGARAYPFSIPKPRGEIRIVAMGGSSTFDVLAKTIEETWTAKLEKLLNADKKGNYRMINAGVGCQTTYGVSKYLVSEVVGWQPDTVLFYTLYNHVFTDIFITKRHDWLIRVLKLVGMRKSLFITCLIEKLSLSSWGYEDKFVSYRSLLSEIVEACLKNNIKPVLIKQLIKPELFPASGGMRRAKGFSPEQYPQFLAIMDEVGRKYDCQVIDFSADSPVCKGRLKDFILDNVHLTDKGGSALAELLYKNIKI